MTDPASDSDTRTPADIPIGLEGCGSRLDAIARWRTPLATVVLGGVLGSAMLGWLGGGSDETVRVETPQAQVSVQRQAILRSGNWFETSVVVRPTRDVADLVISVSNPLWKGMSIDTMMPDAESAESLDGEYAYHFGKVKAGQAFTLKIDGQIQPRALRRLTGAISVADDQTRLASVPLSLTVLP